MDISLYNYSPKEDLSWTVEASIDGVAPPNSPLVEVGRAAAPVLFRQLDVATDLEERLEGTVLDQIPCDFQDFRDPNEYTVAEGVPPHLKGISGWIVSTGSERSLFDLLLAPPECEGLLVRDINWKIKAYVDCVVMLLRISENFSEFNRLITRFEDDTSNSFATEELFLAKKKEIILEKLTQSSLPLAVKNYYCNNLDDLLDYYDCFTMSFSMKPTRLLPNFFESIDYRQHPELFEKLKHYADSGRIITTVGTIEDLEEVSKVIPIGVIDTSNIHDYTVLDIRTGKQTPKIIWVRGQRGIETYFSYTHSPLSKKEYREFNQLLEIFKQTSSEALLDTVNTLSNAFFLEMSMTGQDSGDICLSYSKELLSHLRDYRTKYIYTIQDQSVDFISNFSQEHFFKWVYSSEENLKNVVSDPSFKPFVQLLQDLRRRRTSNVDDQIDKFLSDFEKYQS